MNKTIRFRKEVSFIQVIRKWIFLWWDWKLRPCKDIATTFSLYGQLYSSFCYDFFFVSMWRKNYEMSDIWSTKEGGNTIHRSSFQYTASSGTVANTWNMLAANLVLFHDALTGQRPPSASENYSSLCIHHWLRRIASRRTVRDLPLSYWRLTTPYTLPHSGWLVTH